jgi:hypothetical protein
MRKNLTRAVLVTRNTRRGSALIAVLVIVVMLSLAAYTYSELMQVEFDAAIRSSRMAEARLLADSGAEWAATMVDLRGSDSGENLYHNREMFHRVEVMPQTEERAAGYFSVVAPVSGGGTGPRFGLRNESAKINLNSLAESTLSEIEANTVLMSVPGMTVEIADAILDWIDSDSDPRLYGVESDYYTSFTGFTPANGPLRSLDELLKIDGVTPELLYGEDYNRNGWLDPNEDDGPLSPPDDNQDGILDLGWSEYLTVTASETNLRRDGSEKIPLNSNTLTDVYDRIAEEFDEAAAQFVVAYRVFGPTELPEYDVPRGFNDANATAGLTIEEEEIIGEIASGIASAIGGGDGSVTRGGMDLAGGGEYPINSLFDLIDAEVEATIEGAPQTLISPWRSNDILTYFPAMDDALGITTDTVIEGRININEARFETLAGLFGGVLGLPEEVASAIVAASEVDSEGEPGFDPAARTTNAWLLAEGVVDLATMRMIDPFVTTKGDIFQAQVIGYFGSSGIASRVNVWIDGTKSPPRIIQFSDYSELGAGYPLSPWQEEN